MLHEILGITNNCIDMSSVSGVPKELHKIMLNVEQDDFFAQVDFQNFNITFTIFYRPNVFFLKILLRICI